MSRVLIAAEPGCTHGGKADDMVALIRMAAAAGADAVKFQWVSSPERLCERRRAPEYLDVYRLIAFPPEWHETLAKECELAGVKYACTCYLPEDIAVVAPFIAFHKVASFEAGDREFLRAHPNGRPIWISTGMMEWDQIQSVMGWCLDNCKGEYILLHCVSAYPCPVNQSNLGRIRTMCDWGHRTGFSDHTGSTFTGALAVASGAQVLEVHVRLDGADPENPDYPHALPPRKLRHYVENVRIAEAAVGEGHLGPMPCEIVMTRYRVHG